MATAGTALALVAAAMTTGTASAMSGGTEAPDPHETPWPATPDEPELSSAKDDLAAIRLDRPVHGVTPLRPVAATPAPGTPITFYGHGITAPDTGVADVLRRGRLTVLSDTDCAAATPAVVDGPSVLCAGAVPGQPVQGCFGDSGGPAVVRDEQGEPRLAGIFSFGMETADLPCGAPGINAFADVTSLKGHPMG